MRKIFAFLLTSLFVTFNLFADWKKVATTYNRNIY